MPQVSHERKGLPDVWGHLEGVILIQAAAEVGHIQQAIHRPADERLRVARMEEHL